MKTKLLRKLRRDISILHYSETPSWRERWEFRNYTAQEIKTCFTFEEALSRYHTDLNFKISRYKDNLNCKRILP